MDIDSKKYEIKPHGNPEFPMDFYECDNKVYKDLYVHWHNEMEIIYVITGTIIVFIDDTMIEGKAGDIIFIHPKAVHYIKSGEDLLLFKSLVFDIHMIDGDINDFCHNQVILPLLLHQIEISNIITTNQKNHTQIKNVFFEMEKCYKGKNDFFQIEAKYLLLKLLYILLSSGHYNKVNVCNNKLTSIIRLSLEFIQNNYSQEITPAIIANHVNYNEYYFMKVFKKYTGKTVIKYLTEYRLSQAKQLLVNTDYSIEEICYRIGFSNSSYFTSKFREFYKITPGEFRKQSNK